MYVYIYIYVYNVCIMISSVNYGAPQILGTIIYFIYVKLDLDLRRI